MIKRFKNGEFNVLVSTSIGEEGLDIGEIDMIVCYDAQKTPIRMVSKAETPHHVWDLTSWSSCNALDVPDGNVKAMSMFS